MKAKASYSVTKWEEVTVREVSPQMKMTKASVVYQLSGDLAGAAHIEYLMFYRHSDPNDQHKASADYVGLVHFDGVLSGKTGSCALKDTGTFDAGEARSRLQIIEGSGTGQLKGISGSGLYVANQDGFTWELGLVLQLLDRPKSPRHQHGRQDLPHGVSPLSAHGLVRPRV